MRARKEIGSISTNEQEECIIHRVVFRSDSKLKGVFIELGIPFKDPGPLEVKHWPIPSTKFICICKINENDRKINWLKNN